MSKLSRTERFVPNAPVSAPARSAPAPLFLGERYEDIRFLGEGGMGTVYRAFDPRLGRPVAIKLLKGADPDLWPRFLAEARAQAQVHHDNVVRVYDTGEADGQPFIVMQYIDGQPLSEIAESLTVEQRVRIIKRIAIAVHEAHRLGIIHRDIKPSNILVEKDEGGAFKPYIMDFGLARQIGVRGQTQTGVVLGTLAYMPPEQAKGDWRAMDRRSDVFSLGATLYDLIAGRPPFFAEQPWKVLFLVTHADAPRLGAVKKGVPAALETIVMKCVEREPERRYESARALAEDLKRFLDGVTIAAKPPSVTRVLQKKARRHKVVTAVLAALLTGALVLAGVWLHAERKAEEREAIARDVGVAVKDMELFLRAAHELPLHDVERERDLVRARLAALSERIASAGEAGEGPGEYALGKGYLTLGNADLAREHLERALAAGYSAPELNYALGEALGALFQRALAETKRITNADERKRKVAELEKELREPALSHLRAAGGARIEVPVYAEGLIALHEGRNEDAAAKAREAFSQAPWMYEAKKLEGDALFAEGSKYRHDAAFDYDRMKGYFDQAERAYAAAADIGRSDPSVHLAECDLWEKTAWAFYNKGLPCDEPFAAADAACLRAVEASSKDGRALVQRSLVLSGRVYSQMSAVSERTLDLADESVDLAESGAAACPDDVTAHYAVARAISQRDRARSELGEETTMEAAIDAYERVLVIDPRFTWAWNELGGVLLFEATQDERRGRDISVPIASALRQFERAIAIDPTFALPVGGRLDALTTLFESKLERGQDTKAALGALFEAAEALEKTGFGPSLGAFWKARAHRLRAQEEVARGRDPRVSVDAALATIRAFAGDSPDDYWLLEEIARCRLLEATHALRTGLDPLPAIARAEDAAQKAREKKAPLELLSAQIDLVAARAHAGDRGVGPEMWDRALSRLTPLLDGPRRDPEPFAVAAEALARRADMVARSGKSPEKDARRGLAMAEAALAMNPVMARALLAQGDLHLVLSRAARTEEVRTEEARLAETAYGAAFQNNPLLARERGRLPL